MVWDKEKVYLFTGGVDMRVRSWMAEIGSEAKVFEGATRSVCFLHVRGNICKCSWCMAPRSWFWFKFRFANRIDIINDLKRTRNMIFIVHNS